MQQYCICSVVDPNPNWIRIQDLCGSGSVFGIRIRIQTGKNRKLEAKREKIEDIHKFTIQRFNRLKISLILKTVLLKLIT